MPNAIADVLRRQFQGFYDLDPRGFTTTNEIVANLGFGAHEWIIEEYFPLVGKIFGKARVGIIDPRRDFDEEEIPSILAAHGLVKPEYWHALRFMAQFGNMIPASRKKPYIVFPHEPWIDLRTRPRMLALCRDPTGRRLSLVYPGNGFDKCSVIAGVWLGDQETPVLV
jgi:hypothetical protein